MNNPALPIVAPLTTRVNFAWNFAGKLVYAASRGIILIVIAKLGSALMVGQYALAFAVTAPVFMLADLDLRSILSTDSRNRMEFSDYMGLRIVTAVLAMAAVGVLSMAQDNREAGLIILLVGAAKAIESISDILFGLMQKHERLNQLGISLMIKGVLSVAAVCLPLALGHGLVWGAAGIAAAWLMVLVGYDIPASRRYGAIRPRLAPRTLWRLTLLSLPLGGVLLFSSLNKNLSNYFIEAYHGSESLGYFSSMLYILTTGSLVVSALGQSTNARLARLLDEGDGGGFLRIYGRNMLFTAGLGGCMVLAAAVGGGWILTLMYTSEYAVWQNVFVLIMVAAGISYGAEITASALTAARRFTIQPFISGGVLLAGLVLNFLLVPSLGLRGAALCVMATSGLYLAGNLAALRGAVSRWKKPFEGAAVSDAPLTVEPVEFPDAGLMAQWRDLLTEAGGDTAFSDPQWLARWWQVYGEGREPLVLAVRQDGELTAVFPLMITNGPLGRRVCFMGHPQGTHTDIACRSECRSRVLAVLCEYLADMKGPLIVSLTGLREGPLSELREYLKKVRSPLLAGTAPSPVFRTGGQGYESLIGSRFSSHARKNMARHEKRLAALGTVSLRELTAADMEKAFALHDLRWRKKLDTSGFTDEKSRTFFACLLENPPGRWRALALGLYLDDRLIAFQYGFLCGGRALFYKSAHDDLFGMYAPGKMVKRGYVRQCMSTGYSLIDLGVGFEDYKTEWTDQEELIGHLSFPAGNLPSRILFFRHQAGGRLRDALKQNRRIVLFKRNTLGRWKYGLSPARLMEGCRLGRERILRAGGLKGLPECLIKGRHVHLRLTEPSEPAPASCRAAQATPADAVELALLMDCRPEDIGKRFFRMDRCMVVRTGSAIACAAWTRTEEDRAVISECRADKRICREEDITELLLAILNDLPGGGQTGVHLILDHRNGSALRAARRAGFAPVDQEGSPEKEWV